MGLVGSSLSEQPRPEHGPRSLDGTHICAVVYRRVHCVPRSRGRQKRLQAGRENLCVAQKKCISYLYTHIYHTGMCHVTYVL